MNTKNMDTETAVGCLALLTVWFIGSAIAIAVSVSDLTTRRTHIELDVALLVFFVGSFLLGRI